MKKNLILMFTFLTVFALGVQTASAQITITIPRIPKIKKDKPGQITTKISDYDKQAFTDVTWGNTMYLDPYLECYAKKHNLDLYKVTGDAFSPRYFSNAKEMKQTLQAELSKLAEIESQLKSKLKSRPNTNLPYHENPAVWDEITTNRDQYLQCAIGAKESNKAKESVWLQTHLEEIANRQKEVESFTPERGWFTKTFTYDHVLNAISPQAREKWLKDSKAMEFKEYVDPPLDALAAAIEKKLASYQPNTKAYPIHNLIEEKLMKSKINDLANHKIFYIGLQQANWLIDKNELGIPKNRYKYGMVWVRYAPNDHPYCRVYYINIIQDYAGGGTYGASYGYFVKDELFGCPAK